MPPMRAALLLGDSVVLRGVPATEIGIDGLGVVVDAIIDDNVATFVVDNRIGTGEHLRVSHTHLVVGFVKQSY